MAPGQTQPKFYGRAVILMLLGAVTYGMDLAGLCGRSAPAIAN